MTNKMLSEADLMAGRLRLNTLPLDSIDKEFLDSALSQAKLAIPKPRQDAGRFNAVVSAAKSLVNVPPMRGTVIREGAGFLARWLDLEASLAALTLESKPQTDNGGLVEAARETVELLNRLRGLSLPQGHKLGLYAGDFERVYRLNKTALEGK